MRLTPLLLALLALPCLAYDIPAARGVQVEKPAGDGVNFSIGSGIYLGDALVLTAAHVVEIDPAAAKVTVAMDGGRFDGRLVFAEKERDLALVKLAPEQLPEARRRQPRADLCPAPPPTSHAVLVAAQGAVSRSVTVGTAITAAGKTTDRWTDLLATGYHHGASGGGVFDPDSGCLWGVIRLELSGPSLSDGHLLDLTSFVPPDGIRAFLADFGRQ